MAPLVLALVIGPMMEQNLRLSLVISEGSPWIFLEHPISATFMGLSLFLLLSPLVPWIGGKRKKLQEKVEGEEV
jgi:putative tricarboxylic transport membrane protein